MSKYSKDEKVLARQWLIDLYKRLLGPVIPLDRQYWFLCNRQTRIGSEAAQIVDSGLALPSQLRGVDDKLHLIEKNRRSWPEGLWYHGWWNAVLARSFEAFNPALVYLDSTSTARSRELVSMTVNTMHRCPANTMLCVNVMLNNPAYTNDRWDSEEFIGHLGRALSRKERDIWFNSDYAYHCYIANKTVMAQYVFTSRVLY